MSDIIHIYTDGGSRGNPGQGASAFIAVIVGREGERVLRKRVERIGLCTNNEAEYKALIIGLMWARSRDIERVKLHSDSQLVVRQLKGHYKVKAANLLPLHLKVRGLLKGMEWSVQHHSRGNRWITRCDRMVNEALDAAGA
ncbi:MAG: ribonuclease HI family protein [Candidatus Thermoplasmatota archaeon]|nr:ribonuclease HI family protein [Candidatus Thermoplasmatota archaeon]